MGKVLKRVSIEGAAYALRVPDIVAFDAAEPAQPESDPLFATPPGLADFGFDDIEVPAPQPAEPAVDLEAVRAEAEALIAQGRAESAAAVASGQAEADRLILDARARVAAIESEAHDRGYEAGDKAARAAADAEMADMLETMRGLIDVARSERKRFVEGAEAEVVRLAIAVAERVVHRQLEVDGETIVGIARHALQRLVGRERVTVRVNPADVEMLRGHREALLAVQDVESLRIVEDQRVDRGGVVIETESGTIDAKVSTQAREARRVLRVEDPTAQAS